MRKSDWQQLNIWVTFFLFFCLTASIGFFIVLNAQWLVGDDAILMRKTGSCIPFSLKDFINPSGGRFYPLAYFVYNILLIFRNSCSASNHYIINAVLFTLMAIVMMALLVKVVNEKHSSCLNIWIAFFGAGTILSRTLSVYLEVLYSSSIIYFLMPIFLISVYSFFKNDKWSYGLIAIISAIYMIFSLESVFVFPLAFGFACLLFGWKKMTIKQRVFNLVLISITLIFLSLYYFIVYKNITHAYDGSHGSDVGYIRNFFQIMRSKKILIFAIVIILVRFVDVSFNKDKYNIFYDSLLLAASAYSLGCFVLKLNWTMYYTIAVIGVIPSIVYYLLHYLKGKWTFFILLSVFLFYISKTPGLISNNQNARNTTYQIIEEIANSHHQGYKILWFSAEVENPLYEEVIRDWKQHCLETYIGYIVKDMNYRIQEINSIEFTGDSVVVLCPQENEILNSTAKKEIREMVENHGMKFKSEIVGISSYQKTHSKAN